MNKLYVIGIGPGEYEQMTLKAIHAMEKSEVIIGYTVYVDLVKEHFPGERVPDHSHEKRGGSLCDGF